MSAAAALRSAHTAGVAVTTDGESLILEAIAKPPLARHKTGIISLLQQGACGWTSQEWHALFEERATVAKVDDGLLRLLAEARAYAWCVAQWGSTATLSARRLAAALRVVAAISPMNRFCPSAPRLLAMPGCIRAAGLSGNRDERPSPWQL
jgi:hypothetical protein